MPIYCQKTGRGTVLEPLATGEVHIIDPYSSLQENAPVLTTMWVGKESGLITERQYGVVVLEFPKVVSQSFMNGLGSVTIP